MIMAVDGDASSIARMAGSWAAWYRTLFRTAGLTFVGPYCWLSPAFKDAVAELESAKR